MIDSFISHRTIQKIISRSENWNPLSRVSITFTNQAVWAMCLPMVKVLVENGVDIHQGGHQRSVLGFASAHAARLCDLVDGREVLEFLVSQSDLTKLAEFDKDGLGLLHMLPCGENSPGVGWLVRKLVESGVGVDSFSSGLSSLVPFPPLQVHLLRKSFSIASVLLELGADPNLVDCRSGLNAVMVASHANASSILRQILESSNETSSVVNWGYEVPTISIKNFTPGCTAIHIASASNALECVKFFVEEGLADLDCDTSTGSMTPLHFAASKNCLNVIKYLVSEGCNINAADAGGDTPLHTATRNGHLSSVEALVQLGALNEANKSFETPSMIASNRSLKSIADFLNRRFGQVDTDSLLSSMGVAIKQGELEKCTSLISQGCPLDRSLPGNWASRPLEYSLLCHKPDIFQLIANHGASILGTMRIVKGSEDLYYPILDYVASNPRLNQMLQSTLSQFLKQGGDFVHGDPLPTHAALLSKNSEALLITLAYLEANKKEIG